MASDSVPTDVRVDEVNRPIQAVGRSPLRDDPRLRGSRHKSSASALPLTNISSQKMVLAEQEFDREMQAACWRWRSRTTTLRPGDGTTVFVIRQGLTMGPSIGDRASTLIERMSPRASVATIGAISARSPSASCGPCSRWAPATRPQRSAVAAGAGDQNRPTWT